MKARLFAVCALCLLPACGQRVALTKQKPEAAAKADQGEKPPPAPTLARENIMARREKLLRIAQQRDYSHLDEVLHSLADEGDM
ncbi:MAG: hypothetical protein N3A66_02160, partial [Planctomycetota bacterium]|nr:hypothetical protein [Planctomycetota bacterium]